MKKPKNLIDEDGEVRELTLADFESAVSVREVDPELAAFARARKRGRPKKAETKRLQSFKLSGDVIDAIRASGAGYNVRVEQVLRQALFHGQI